MGHRNAVNKPILHLHGKRQQVNARNEFHFNKCKTGLFVVPFSMDFFSFILNSIEDRLVIDFLSDFENTTPGKMNVFSTSMRNMYDLFLS